MSKNILLVQFDFDEEITVHMQEFLNITEGIIVGILYTQNIRAP